MADIRCLDSDEGNNWVAYMGDCVDVVRQIPDNSIDLAVYSPPFGDLFVYSDSDRDMGNSSCDGDFFEHYEFLVAELLRVIKPGRLCVVHSSDLPARKWKDGYIGIRPFSDDISACHRRLGWIMQCRTTIRKCPVTEMQRTKALGLLHKQLLKDSTRSRTAMPDYLHWFVKPGNNGEPVSHTNDEFPVDRWQLWAEPVWDDISQTRVLNVRGSKGNGDEKHICPLQLDLIERVITMTTNHGDIILSPFMGIGSEGWCALKMGRKFVGVELKREYWSVSTNHFRSIDGQGILFDACVNV